MQRCSSTIVGASPAIDHSGEDSPRAGRRATWLPPSAQLRAARSPSAISPRGRSTTASSGRLGPVLHLAVEITQIRRCSTCGADVDRAAHQHGLLVLQFTSFNGAVNGGNEGENLISGIFCCSYGVWLVVTHPVRCVWLPTATTAFWCSAGVCTPWPRSSQDPGAAAPDGGNL